MTATAIAGVIGGPMSGALLQMHGVLGLQGWQWLFLLEGVPAVVLGLAVLRWLPNGPPDAAWLAAEERESISARLAARSTTRWAQRARASRDAFTQRARVAAVAACISPMIVAFYGVASGFRRFSRRSGIFGRSRSASSRRSRMRGGLGHGDRRAPLRPDRRATLARRDPRARRRRRPRSQRARRQTPMAALAALSIAALGVWSALGPFWTWPPQFLRGRAAAGGIAHHQLGREHRRVRRAIPHRNRPQPDRQLRGRVVRAGHRPGALRRGGARARPRGPVEPARGARSGAVVNRPDETRASRPLDRLRRLARLARPPH